MARAPMADPDARTRNLALVVGRLAAEGPVSRTELADATGLARGSIRTLASTLIDAGVVREATVGGGNGGGRPRTVLRLATDDLALITARIDADAAVAVLHAISGDELARFTARHGGPVEDPGTVLDVLAQVLDAAIGAADQRDRRVGAVTLVASGVVGGEPAIVRVDHELGWRDVDVIGGLRERMPRLLALEPGLPQAVTLLGEGTAAAHAELDAPDAPRGFVYVSGQSGLGGAVVVDGAVLPGAFGSAGALGHLAIDPTGVPCRCGQHGCLVTIAGPEIVLERAGLTELRREHGLAAALEELRDRIDANDQHAVWSWNDAVLWIGRALRALDTALDPSAIVVGGYWAELVGDIADAVATDGFLSDDPEQVPLVLAAAAGTDAALLGGFASARSRLLADPLQLAV
ncbi:ROK family protein [Agromyces sp. SYSU T00194]|uniref:ROK family protein n=1 Tax=Agromyces chitinivorans TaxID=3158560 RepID=UPI0033968B3B